MNSARSLPLARHPLVSLLLTAIIFLCIGAGMGRLFEPTTGLISPALIGIVLLIPASAMDARNNGLNRLDALALKVCAMMVCTPLGVVAYLVLSR
jgi:hypothetical protein